MPTKNRKQKDTQTTPPRSERSPDSTGSLKEGLIHSKLVTARERRAALSDLMGAIVVGPPGGFPVNWSMARALFGLALNLLAKHDKTTADVLDRYAGMLARKEALDWKTTDDVLKMKWLLSALSTRQTVNLEEDFDHYRRAVGKQTCHLRTLRRQDELLRTYGRTHGYPAPSDAHARRTQRQAWVRKHLRAMMAEAQVVPCWCWHSQSNLTDKDMAKLVNNVDEYISLSKLSALVLGQLHGTTPAYVLKRLQSRRRQ